jgi:hypothetical protein
MQHYLQISQNHGSKLKLALCLLPTLLLLLMPPMASAADWKVFSPLGGEFSIDMPDPVEVKVVDTADKPGQKAAIYSTHSDSINYGVLCNYLGTNKVSAADFMKASVLDMQKSGVVTDVNAVSGEGWTGETFVYNLNDKPVYHGIIAFNADANVGLSAQLSDASPFTEDSKKFLGSLKVYPDKARTAFDPNGSDAAHRTGQDISKQIAPLWLLVGLGLGVFLMKRLQKAKAAKQSPTSET